MIIAKRLGLLGLALSALAGCATTGDVIVDDRSISSDDGRGYTASAARDSRDGRDDRDGARRDGDVEVVPLRDATEARGGTRASPLPPPARADRAPITTQPSAPLTETYVVAPGDTIYGIAFRNGLDFRALAAWNDVPPPFTIKTGQRLMLTAPRSAESTPSLLASPRAEAAPIDRAPPARPMPIAATPATMPAGTPAIRSSAPAPSAQQNLPSNVEELRDAPEAPRDPSLFAGANATPATIASAPPSVAASSSAPRVIAENPARPASTGAISAAIAGTSAPRAPPSPPPPPKPVATHAPPVTAATTVDTGPSQSVAGIRWRWPARGQLVARFTAGDAARQGIDIQGTVGQAVAAAADGEVVYSGNGLLGYGELIIIKHSPEFLSAYGYNRRRLVNEGQRVKAGQAIAEMGQTGAALSLVHFEIRQAGRPVDPLRFLPRR
jgi:lipoprotein NlpD